MPTVIHMDPIVVDDERIDGLREQVRAVLAMVNPTFSFHDFRMTDGENRVNLIFDLAVPCDMKIEERTRAVKEIGERLREIDGRYRAVMQIDDDYRC